MERAFDGKLYPEMKLIFHRMDDGSETTVLTVDVSDVPIGYCVISNHYISALLHDYDCRKDVKKLAKQINDIISFDQLRG